MTRAQKLAVVTCVATYVLIIIGGIVRITDSGLGCPDWPLCHGQIIPPREKAVLIEFSHRSAAAIVGFFIIAMGIGIWRQHRERLIRSLMLAVYPLLALQVVLGGITVKRELPASIVATHHGTAMLLLALLILITSLSILRSRGQMPDAFAPQARWALAAALAVLALMVTGSYVAASGASLAFPDWPLFDGRLLPTGGNRYQDIHALHRITAAAVGVIIVAFAAYTVRTTPRLRPLVRLSVAAVWLYAAQVIIGAANIWTTLSDGVAAAHLAVGVLLWITFVLISIVALHYAEPSAEATRAEAGRAGLVRE